MNATPPFGEVAEGLISAAMDDDDPEFAFQVLGDHLEEVGLAEFSRMIRDRDFRMFLDIHKYLSAKGFNPARMEVEVERRRNKKFAPAKKSWKSYCSFFTRTGHWGVRIAIRRQELTPLFTDPFG